jgi:hypothetical protein
MRRILFTVLYSVLLSVPCFSQGPHVVIPVPAEVQMMEGTYSYASEPDVKISMVK